MDNFRYIVIVQGSNRVVFRGKSLELAYRICKLFESQGDTVILGSFREVCRVQIS